MAKESLQFTVLNQMESIRTCPLFGMTPTKVLPKSSPGPQINNTSDFFNAHQRRTSVQEASHIKVNRN